MTKFEKRICISNIYALSKQKGIKIGDIESNAGVSMGYLSRLNKEDNKSVPGIEFLLSVSEMMEVSLETLVNVDLTGLKPDEIRLLKFIRGLIDMTNNDCTVWKKECEEDLYLYQQFDEYSITAMHPLMIVDHSYDEQEIMFYSHFLKKNISEITAVFSTCIQCNATIYLISFNTKSNGSVIEMYMSIDSNPMIIPLCYKTDTEKSIFSVELKELYALISDNLDKFHLDKHARLVIDTFLGDL